MIHQDFPQAAGLAANHCDALLKRRAAPAELAPEFERLGERLAGPLRRCLEEAWGDRALQVRSLGSRATSVSGLSEAAMAPAALSLHGFGHDHELLLCIDGRAVLEQLDRALGGTGEIAGELPEALPFSADLLAKRLEAQVMAVVSGELGGIEFRAGERGGDAGALVNCSAEAELTLLRFEVRGGGARAWPMSVAVETEHLSVLLPRRSSRQADRAPRKRSVGEAPFGVLPLAASASLVDMAVPLVCLAELTPGAVLPIKVARNVPLRIGETIVARGAIGEVDDQVALQINQTFSGKDFQ
jgi:flagellar motor switch protein FliM